MRRGGDFNSMFSEALKSKLDLQEKRGSQLVADTELKNQQAQYVGLDTRSSAGLRGAQAGLAGEQARLAERDVNSLVGERDASARSSAIGANIAGGTFLAQDRPEAGINIDPFSSGSNSLGSIYDNPDSGAIGGTQPYKRDYGLGYAAGGLVDPMSADYPIYRKAAMEAGVAVLPPETVMKIISGKRQAEQQKARAYALASLQQGATAPQGYASGGMIEGPGTGKSDSIPAIVDGVGKAAVSDGEFLIPKHVVEYFGTKMFDGLVEKARMAGKQAQRKEQYKCGGVVKHAQGGAVKKC